MACILYLSYRPLMYSPKMAASASKQILVFVSLFYSAAIATELRAERLSISTKYANLKEIKTFRSFFGVK